MSMCPILSKAFSMACSSAPTYTSTGLVPKNCVCVWGGGGGGAASVLLEFHVLCL